MCAKINHIGYAAFLVLFISICGINTETQITIPREDYKEVTTTKSVPTTEFIELTTIAAKAELTTVEQNFTMKYSSRQARIDNGSLDDITMEVVETNPPEVHNVKVINEETAYKPPESASRVIMPVNFRNISNIINKEVINKNDVIKNPVRRIVKPVDENENKPNKRGEIQQQLNRMTGDVVDGAHPCNRECREGEEPMICYYSFHLEWYQTMSKACYNCPYNVSDCFRLDCIPADGINRALNVVNRKMPGPPVEICQHDRVIVDVENDLMTEGTTVHWHGQHQRGTPYMDGTPYVTQCPILPETTFRYQFNATHAGTHFWHSHSGMQRADGAAGAFIVRKPKSQDPHGVLYDYDRSEHVMIVTDWIHQLSVSMFTDHHHSKGDNKPPTLLINGLGRFKVFNSTRPFYMKAASFNVEQGYKYRFRVINAEFLNCPIELSVDGHNITVIASDGYDLEPITATSLVTYAGERYDFILNANNEIDNYWIRYRGLMDCDERFTKAKQVAVLHYEGAMETEPAGDPTWEELHNDGLQLNALNKGEEEDETISVAEMRSLAGYDDSLKEVPDYQFFVAYDFYLKNNSHFHKSPYYGYYQVPNTLNRLTTPQLNHISMKMPSSPLMITRPSSDNFCNSSSIDEACKAGYCECPHILSVKLNSVVEVIILDEGVTFDANHPFHLHGHSFRVVGLRRLSNETTIEEVKAFDKAGLLKRNLKNPPIKDTVTVPDGGYTVIRFKADNPGYWLFHCHIEFHVEIGMALVFKVGEHKDMAPVPRDFPTCGSYIPDNMLELATTEKPKDDSFISISQWWPVVVGNHTSSDTLASVSWLRFGDLFGETEGFVCGIMDEVIKTNNYRKYIMKDGTLDICRACHLPGESLRHVISGCSSLANGEYLHRHNQVARIIHQQLALKYNLVATEVPYYRYTPEGVLENDHATLYWDRSIITDRTIVANKPDIVLVDRSTRQAIIVDIAVPHDVNLVKAEKDKETKYLDLAHEITDMWDVDSTIIVPIVVTVNGLVAKSLDQHLRRLTLGSWIKGQIQKAVLLSTARIVRRFLSL